VEAWIRCFDVTSFCNGRAERRMKHCSLFILTKTAGKEAAATASTTVGEGFPFFSVPKTSPCGATPIIGWSRAWTDQKARGGVVRPMVSRSTRRASGLRPHEGVVWPSRT
jgi:hypothetical protein